MAAQPFELAEVRLLDGPVRDRQERNRRYLLSLDPDRLLHNFRVQAGLPSSAAPLGGWEAPDHGLRGHFVGHYLAACAQMWAATGDAELQERVDLLVEGLSRCQRADGYLSAFPEQDLAVIETRFEGAWASYYVLHKVLTGLVEAHRHTGNGQALAMAIRLAAYVRRRIDALEPVRLERMLRTDSPNPTNETGGWSETLHALYDVTRDREHLELAGRFEPVWFLQPLAERRDQLAGLHCNTHIPLVLGAARRYEHTGDPRLRDAVVYFWECTALARSYINGGSSGPRPDGREKSQGGEHWPEAEKLAGTLTPKINESCVTHNMLRLTDTLFRWTAAARFAEFYERSCFNSVLCMQHPGYPGGYLYDHPLGSHSRKCYGHAEDSFWCCYGSTVEAYARLGQGIYYHDDDSLWVNLFVPSELNWRQKRVRIEQRTRFPREGASRLLFHCAAPTDLCVNLRLPAWSAGVRVLLNGDRVDLHLEPGGYCPVRRAWREGDVLEIRHTLALRAETLPGDDRQIAFLHGPIVLAALGDEDLVLHAPNAAAAVARIEPVDPGALRFRTTLASGREVTLVPLSDIVEEPFGVYFTMRSREAQPSPVP